ncbi:hypothetical protein ROJ8625_04083 [Roseivivax jejudonensis]|uniref:DUF5658 domain-containing protein n=1 Tax=Roseivivax jejudonensis TaxID=1529041 RepID=A0A1X7AAS0_9RHOB|nr:DUF5658 family protein [Roseivivax jejudonensis]SLN74708.1 hypothetical protein ROJ8625_04083 [Roseivivax jejudonensis]
MTAALIAFGIATLFDIITTIEALERGGREANPVVRFFMSYFGRLWWVAKLALAGVAAWLFVYADSAAGIWIMAVVTGYVAYRNTKVAR